MGNEKEDQQNNIDEFTSAVDFIQPSDSLHPVFFIPGLEMVSVEGRSPQHLLSGLLPYTMGVLVLTAIISIFSTIYIPDNGNMQADEIVIKMIGLSVAALAEIDRGI